MKKYKLIKEYPQGPKLNSIVRIESPTSDAELYCPNDLILLNASFGTYWVENKKYSDFWEEIKSCNLIVDKWHKIYFFNSDKIYYLKPSNNKKNYGESLVLIRDSKIYTYYSKDRWDCNDIKSAEVLTDLTEIQNYLPAYHRDKIKKLPEYVKCIRNNEFDYGTNGVGKIFKVIGETDSKNDYLLSYNNEKLVSSDKRRFIPASKEEYIKYINHCKKPLFKTEDGFNIYPGNTYYNLWEKGFRNELKPFEINGPHRSIEDNFSRYYYHKECKYFSTKEAAEKWVLMNKPSLSINDILDNYEKDGMLDFMKFSNKLIKLVKSKS